MTPRIICAIALAGWLPAMPLALSQTVMLHDLDSGLTSPQGNYRWLDVADQVYSATYRADYDYTQAAVSVAFHTDPQPVYGVLSATNLKPNFAYQLKLVGTPGTPCNPKIGRAGRYWQEVWNGSAWANGWNLNDKGSGYYPTPNDTTYLANRDALDPTSPTGKKYQHTCYLVFDYFITDADGNANVPFQIDNSYHVLWKTNQRNPSAQDGPAKTATFDPAPSQAAYATDYASQTVSIFGEWERLPAGGIQLLPGDYTCQVILTEESFHGSGGEYAGGWAAAMGGDVSFRITPRVESVAVAGGLISLQLTGCYVGITHRLERSFELSPGSTWEEIFTFVSQSPTTNWSEAIPPGANHAFYRMASQVEP